MDKLSLACRYVLSERRVNYAPSCAQPIQHGCGILHEFPFAYISANSLYARAQARECEGIRHIAQCSPVGSGPGPPLGPPTHMQYYATTTASRIEVISQRSAAKENGERRFFSLVTTHQAPRLRRIRLDTRSDCGRSTCSSDTTSTISKFL